MLYRQLWIIILCILLTGCWDNMEIQNRGYIIGISVDKTTPIPKGFEEEEEYKQEIPLEEVPLQKGESQYAYTIQIPILAMAKNKAAGGGGGGGDAVEATWNLTILGNSFMQANRTLATRLDYPPYYEHLQTIVLSDEVAREGISKPLDLFLRDHEMRRRTRIFVIEGEAKKVLDVIPKIDDYPSLYLAKLPNSSKLTSRIPHLVDLGVVSESIHGGNDFILPRITVTKNEIRNAGLAVFKGEKMVGWLDEIHTIYAKWIRDLVKGGIIMIEDPRSEEGILVLEVKKAKTKVRPLVTEEQINMKIDVKATFNLAEKFGSHHSDALDNEYIKEMEAKTEQYMKNQIKNTIKHVQKEFGADIFLFNVQMQRYEPKVWELVKDDWEDIFKQIDPEVIVKVKIKQIGTMK